MKLFSKNPISQTRALVTIPPYAPFIDEIAAHPIVSGLRLNTVMPTKEPLEDLLGRLEGVTRKHGKDLWIDLKARQLRVANYGVPPFTEIELTHHIDVATPVTAYFSDGLEQATVLAVTQGEKGSKLIMQEGPKRVVGPGESINILSADLKIDGFLTPRDKEYIAAAQKVGVKNYMLSFVEKQSDLDAVFAYVPDARIIAKLESNAGLSYAAKSFDARAPYAKQVQLMAARGDLFIQMERPHKIMEALELVIARDSCAVVGSRILSSLSESYTPSCADLSDADNLMRMGYRTLMLGDDICQKRESALSALNVLSALAYRS